MDVRAQNAHGEIERVPDEHDDGTEHISYGARRDQVEPDGIELLGNDHARKHEPEETRIAQYVG